MSRWLNGRASAAFAGVPGSIYGWGIRDFFFCSCRSFTSKFPFSFFLSLSLSFDLSLALKTHSSHVSFNDAIRSIVKVWWCRLSRWLNGRASAAFAGLLGSIPAGVFAIFFRFCQSFTPNSLSPSSSFPLPSPFDLLLALKTPSSHLSLNHVRVFIRDHVLQNLSWKKVLRWWKKNRFKLTRAYRENFTGVDLQGY